MNKKHPNWANVWSTSFSLAFVGFSRSKLKLVLRTLACVAVLSLNAWSAQAVPPIYLWFEPEWFEGVEGYCEYHSDPERLAQVQGRWGIAGPGISAEWTQGGESEWNSMAAGPNETKAICQREFFVPRAGKYRVWVRYYDHRDKPEPFRVRIEQSDKPAINARLGVEPVVPPNDEYSLYWGFSFGWGSIDGELRDGPATLKLLADEQCETWRQLDAVLITDDFQYQPVGREKPSFAYFDAFALQPDVAAFARTRAGEGPRSGERGYNAWRGSGKNLNVGASWKRAPVGGRDFSMWTVVEHSTNWWAGQNLETVTPYDLHFNAATWEDLREPFRKQFAGRTDVPILSWKGLMPGFRLGSPDLSPESPLRKWLDRTKSPFFILTNNSGMQYNPTNGPATYAALTGPLASQFLGYISGEAIGPEGVNNPKAPLGVTRREHVDAFGRQMRKENAAIYSQGYQTAVPEDFRSTAITCLSAHSIALTHLMHEIGAKLNGYEVDGTMLHTPMRIAYARGAARQYGGGWINYASSNFGDACTTFFQEPHVPRGAKAWFHSKYSITDGPPVSWYRNLYYLNYLSGASAIFWEQYLANQWIKPGPGEHPVQLSPFGRATVDFQEFVDRLPDRGEPYAPIGVLLSYGNGYDPFDYLSKMLLVFRENVYDRELRELYNVCWFPAPIREGQPATPMRQNLMSGRYGNIFDVLVDRPNRLQALAAYPIVWAAGDVDLGEKNLPGLKDYVNRGGTLVVNVVAAKDKLPAEFLGLSFKNDLTRYEEWRPAEGASLPCTPYHIEVAEPKGAKPLAFATGDVPIITRHQVGEGAVICTLIPHNLGYDERAHPSLPYLMNGLTQNLLPIEVSPADGSAMYQLNKTKDGWLVGLFNNGGVDKTQHGIARVDRRAFVDVVLKTKLPVKSAKEWTQPRDLKIEKRDGQKEVSIRVPPGDVQVVTLVTQ